MARKRIDRGECPVCGKHKSQWKRRKDWSCCSIECSKRILEVYDKWSDTRMEAIKRDDYKCSKCGHAPIVEDIVKGYVIESFFPHDGKIILLRLPQESLTYLGRNPHCGEEKYDPGGDNEEPRWHWVDTDFPMWHSIKEYVVYIDPGLLIVDHIKAIALGGDEFDLNNLQTLCKKCNRLKTKDDAGLIATHRKNNGIEIKRRKHDLSPKNIEKWEDELDIYIERKIRERLDLKKKYKHREFLAILKTIHYWRGSKPFGPVQSELMQN